MRTFAKMSEYCNNCGRPGHSYIYCKVPITSIGVIVFRRPPESTEIEYLMIRRKDTLGYIDFMRGKYTVHNKHYIINMLKQMTVSEKERLKSDTFQQLWDGIWGGSQVSSQYKVEEATSREKIYLLKSGILVNNDYYTLSDLIEESNRYCEWVEAEWGFPKGRRNYQEKDFECALREFNEETGYSVGVLKNIENILPFEEIFTGSNYKSYKHKYYIMYMEYSDSLEIPEYEKSEVSKMEWKSYEGCMESIRSYNIEKRRVITNVHQMLMKYRVVY